MKIQILILNLIFLTHTLGGQNSKLLDDLNFFIVKPSQEKLEGRQKLFDSVDLGEITDLSNNHRWSYNLVKSNLLCYSNQDSSLFYFLKAHTYNPGTTCDIMRDLYKAEKMKLMSLQMVALLFFPIYQTSIMRNI